MAQKPDLKCVGGTSVNGGASVRRDSLGSGLLLPVFDKLQVVVSSHLKRMLAQFFDSIDDAFFDLAERASFSREQEDYFDTMRTLRLQRNAMIAHCMIKWEESFTRACKTPESDAGAMAMSCSELSLMQHEELEENVAIDGIVKKSREAVAHGLYALNARITAVLRAQSLTQEYDPVDARIICDAFRQACSLVDVDIKHKLILYKLFEKQFLAKYPAIVRDGNALFIEAGVLPDIKGIPQERKEGRAEKSPQAGAPDVSSSLSGDVDNGPQDAPQSFIANLQSLMQAVRAQSSAGHQASWSGGASGAGQGGAAPGGSGAGHFSGIIGSPLPAAKPVATPQLVSMLSSLQQAQPSGHAHQFGEAMPDINVRSSLNTLIGQQSAALGVVRVQDQDTNTIDLVAMLFEYILGDENLPERIKALIGRLQIPTLKVAILDPALFSRSSHPARRLINDMARAAIGLSQSPEIVKDTLFLKIQGIVQSLLNEFNDDLAVFEAKLREFNQFMDVEIRRASILEQRTRAVEEGKARSDEATEKANQAIIEHTGDALLPRVVVSILETVWQQYLYLVYLKQGADSVAWKAALETIDDLIASVTPVDSDEQREKLFAKRDTLDKMLRVGFKTVSFNPFEMNQLLAELAELQQDVLRKDRLDEVTESEPADQLMEALSRDLDSILGGQKTSSGAILKQEKPVAKVTPLKVARKSEEVEPSLPALPDDDADWARAKSMQVGCWMEYLNIEGAKVRCKLVAFIRSVDKMIFVNRAGVKLFERTTLAFAHDLKSGKVALLDDSLLFDRALENVIGNLKKIRQQKL